MSQGLLYTEQIPMVLSALQEVSHLTFSHCHHVTLDFILLLCFIAAVILNVILFIFTLILLHRGKKKFSYDF